MAEIDVILATALIVTPLEKGGWEGVDGDPIQSRSV